MLSTIKRIWPQWLAGIAVTSLLIQVGLIGAWSSPYIAKLTADNSSLPLSVDEASWIASLMNLSRLFGGIIGAAGCQIIGSKMTNTLSVIPATIGWILTILANSAEWLYAARLAGGLSVGMAFACFPLYLGEISDPKTRGALVAMAVIGAPIGNTLVALVGAIFDLVESSIAFLIMSIILIIFFILLPESPHHLIKKTDIKKVKDSIAWYNRECDVDAEYAELEKFIFTSNSINFRQQLGEFGKPSIQRATFVIIALSMFMQMSGLNNIIFYMTIIMTNAKVTIIDPSMCATVVMSFGIVSAIVAVNLIDRLGRRGVLICAATIFAASLIALEIHFIRIDNGDESSEWLPIVSLIVAEISIFLGLTSVPSAVLSELFPPNIKCMASCFFGISSAIFGFICTKTYQPLLDVMGHRYVYWIYIVIELFAIPFAIFIMPETKGKSLQQIQNEMIKEKSSNRLTTNL